MKKTYTSSTFKHAFSMIELIFVIVILGIVASIGSEIIAKTYESYLNQRTLHNASLKTELVATQIANRLERAIPGTIVRRTGRTTPATLITNSGNPTDRILQWVGADIDSFNANGWTGFCDLTRSPVNRNILHTPGLNGSILTNTLTIINNLNGNSGIADVHAPYVYFHTKAGLQSRAIDHFETINSNIILTDNNNALSEHYKLAWTSYALEIMDNPATQSRDLVLHYNFPPILRRNITHHLTRTLLRNVTTFEFRGDGNTVRFKLCIRESPTDRPQDDTIICKEKAVF